MHNDSLRHRPLFHFAAGLAAAAAVLVPTVVDGGAASAEGNEPVPDDLPDDLKTVIDPRIVIDPFPPSCFDWWCEDPSIFFQPDYVAIYDLVVQPVPTYYKGIRATRYGIQMYNDGVGNPGAVYSTVAALGGERVLGIETRGYTDVEVSPVSETATRSAPLGQAHLDDAWIIHDVKGLEPGYFNKKYMVVWVSGNGEAPLELRVNEHVGVDLLGTPGLDGYRHPEDDRSNNRVTWSNRRPR